MPTPGTVVAGAPLLPMLMPRSDMSENPEGGDTEDDEEPVVVVAEGTVLLVPAEPGMTCWITRGLMILSYRIVAP